MRVLILTDCHLPVPAVQGGAVQTLIESLIRENEKNPGFKEKCETADSDVHFDVLSVYDPEAEKSAAALLKTEIAFISHNKGERMIDNGIQSVLEKAIPSRKGRPLNLIWKNRVLRKAAQMLKDKDYDAVILENQGYLTRLFKDKQLRSKYSEKVYYHLHNEIPDSVYRPFMKEVKFLLISRYLSGKILDIYGDKVLQNIFILKNGIKTDEFSQKLSLEDRKTIRKRFNVSDRDHLICFAGRIAKEKGIEELLLAMEQLSDENIKLVIVGAAEFGNQVHSDFEKRIVELCRKLDRKVVSTGYVPHEDIWKYYQASDFAVLPSIWEEPAGLTVLEAMASGLPVVTTGSGGIREYIYDRACFVENSENVVEQLVHAITEISENMDDYRKSACSNRKFVNDNYSEEQYYREFIKMLKRM